MMNILIHDRKGNDGGSIIHANWSALLNNEETKVISDNGKINRCTCCFGCWLKTPGQCVIKDGYENMGRLFSTCDKLIIISRCFYGMYSPFVKNVLDRGACPYLLPYFKTRNGETHHPKRYKNKIALTAYFYGKIPDAEKETARKLVKANGVNLFSKTEVFFYDSFEEIKGVS